MRSFPRRLVCFLIAGLVCIAAPMRASAENCRIYGHCKNESKLIALTFDDGPHPRITPTVLDILACYGIKATFFEVGSNVENYPDAARRVAEEGHEIGNHTYSHPHVNSLDQATLEKETDTCEEAILRITGIRPVLFRPPEGVIDSAVKVMSSDRDYSVILWSIDTRDWAGTSVDAIVKNVSNNVKSGDIILMHDYVSSKCNTVAALRIIIPELLGRGYTFVTVSRLIEEMQD